jgi:hypothetical protein
MNPIKILIVGLGQIGSRYLQGLCASALNIEVHVIEPSDHAYESGLSFFNSELVENLKILRLDISSLNLYYDVAIVATSSQPRTSLIQQLVSRVTAKGWILEKVLAQTIDDLYLISNALASQAAWVNTPRRITSVYAAIKERVGINQAVLFTVNLPAFALACNSIHFIDVVAWLSDSSVIKVSTSTEDGWYKSKRVGYQEFNGSLSAFYENGSELKIDNTIDAKPGIYCRVNGIEYFIDENEGVYINDKLVATGRVEYQSELTEGLVAKILAEKTNVFLPKLTESIEQHRHFFEGLAANSILYGSRNKIWPIT